MKRAESSSIFFSSKPAALNADGLKSNQIPVSEAPRIFPSCSNRRTKLGIPNSTTGALLMKQRHSAISDKNPAG
eukprot:6359315-Karenia_brevis.AAC.1